VPRVLWSPATCTDQLADPPLVSVILTTFERSALVRRAIDSVLRQTLDDFELIVGDDGSADDTNETLARIEDPRVSVIRHDINLGLGDARNSGIRRAKGSFACFLDDDDEWLPSKLAVQVAAFQAQDDGADVLVYSQAIVDDGLATDVRPTRGLRPGEPLS